MRLSRGRVDHLVERRDAGNRLALELAERIRDGADQPAVHVDGAAAHPGDDAGGRQRAALEPREDQVPAGADDVAKDAQDMDLERLDAIAFEHGPADAFHAGNDFLDGHDRRDGARGPDRGRGEK